MTTPPKPAYLGTLNAISLGEADAGRYLTAWAAVTPDEGLKCALEFVAARETSHGDVFRRRIEELGFELRCTEKDMAESDERCGRYGSASVSDEEKIGPQPDGADDGVDPFAQIEKQLGEGLYDPLTALLMRWYIAEERDSGQILRDAYRQVRASAKPAGNGSLAGLPSGDAEAIMACMTAGFDRLEKALLAAAGSNGRSSKSRGKVKA